MNIAVIGAGYVGLTTSACFASLGHNVVCVEKDAGKLSRLKTGRAPFHEPGLDSLVYANQKAGRLSFAGEISGQISSSSIFFIAVGTPPNKDGTADVSQILGAVRDIAEFTDSPKTIVNRSTAPPGTCCMITEELAGLGRRDDIVIANPEFLKEGSAVADFSRPDRVDLGSIRSADAIEVAKLYEALECPILTMSCETAEISKYAANAFLATSISFVNGLAQVCEQVGADVSKITQVLKLDRRIGAYAQLDAGAGFGGSCLPKDVDALAGLAGKDSGLTRLLDAVRLINENQAAHILSTTNRLTGGVRGKVIAIWGLSFKPGSDDTRRSPAIDIARALLEKGAKVRAHDPLAGGAARELIPEVEISETAGEAVREADALLVLTAWPEYLEVDMVKVKESMAGRLIVDGRNLLDQKELEEMGFAYLGVGRGGNEE